MLIPDAQYPYYVWMDNTKQIAFATARPNKPGVYRVELWDNRIHVAVVKNYGMEGITENSEVQFIGDYTTFRLKHFTDNVMWALMPEPTHE